jgi:hypothetical protein
MTTKRPHMRHPWILLAFLSAACVEGPAPEAPRPAVPIKSACQAGSRAPASAGFEVRPGRRHSEARTLLVTNVGASPRAVLVDQVTRAEGACSGEWARTTSLPFLDAATGEPPREVTVAPGVSVEIRVGDQRSLPTWGCTKLGLALWMKVDGENVCADAGAWIAERGSDD